MKLKDGEVALHNTSTVSVLAYPIEEAQIDEQGNAIIDRDTQQWKTTGNTYEWSIAAGEKKIFPRYVASYLMGIYSFLKEVDVSGEKIVEEAVDDLPQEEDTAEGEEDENPLACKMCDFVASDMRGLGMHMGAKHPDALARL